MPHVVIEGPIDLSRIHREIAPFEDKYPGLVLKLRDSFLSRTGSMLLFDAVVVEGTTRRFLVEADAHQGEITVRLYPPTDPEKTPGVKRMVAEVGGRILALEPRARVVRTNLAGLEGRR